MIKRLIIAILIALPMSVFAQKFGYVDAEAVITKMPEYEAMQKQLNEASEKYQVEFNKLQEEMDKKMAEYQTLEKDASTPSSIKERRAQDMQEFYQKIEQFRNTASQDLERQRQQLMAPIEQKFQDAVKAVGQDGGYVFIMPTGVTFYNGPSVEDVTSAVAAKVK